MNPENNTTPIILIEDYDVTKGNQIFFKRVDREAPNGFSIHVSAKDLTGVLNGTTQVVVSNIEDLDKFFNHPKGTSMLKTLNATPYNGGFNDSEMNYRYVGVDFKKVGLTGGKLTLVLKIN